MTWGIIETIEARASSNFKGAVEVGSFDSEGNCITVIAIKPTEALDLVQQLIKAVEEINNR